jgi:hypothetical protein
MIIAMFVFAVGLRLTLPNGMAGAVSPFPHGGLAAAGGFLDNGRRSGVAVGRFTARAPGTTAIAVAGSPRSSLLAPPVGAGAGM